MPLPRGPSSRGRVAPCLREGIGEASSLPKMGQCKGVYPSCRGVCRGRVAPFWVGGWAPWGVPRGLAPLGESLSEASSLLTGWVGGRGSLGARSPFHLPFGLRLLAKGSTRGSARAIASEMAVVGVGGWESEAIEFQNGFKIKIRSKKNLGRERRKTSKQGSPVITPSVF